jgi:nuclear transport factor 2 (NTF2) superfamily protein
MVAGHDAGTYADTGDKFVTEWNHLWQFNEQGLAIMMRACNGEQVNQDVPWDHTIYKSPKLNNFEKEKGLKHVKEVIKCFAQKDYHKILPLCTADVQWLDQGRVLPGHNTSGIYKGHAALRDLFLKYEQFYRFYKFEAVRYIQSKEGSIICVQGNDSGVFVKDNGKVSSEWNHIFYLSDNHEHIEKVRFISGELVAKD